MLQAEEEYARKPTPATWAAVVSARERAEQDRTRAEALARLAVEEKAKREADAKAAELAELAELLPRTSPRAMFEHMRPALAQLASAVRVALAALDVAEEARDAFNATLGRANALATRLEQPGPTGKRLGTAGVAALLAYIDPIDLARLRPLTFPKAPPEVGQMLEVGLGVALPRELRGNVNENDFRALVLSDLLEGTDLVEPFVREAMAEHDRRSSTARAEAAQNIRERSGNDPRPAADKDDEDD